MPQVTATISTQSHQPTPEEPDVGKWRPGERDTDRPGDATGREDQAEPAQPAGEETCAKGRIDAAAITVAVPSIARSPKKWVKLDRPYQPRRVTI